MGPVRYSVNDWESRNFRFGDVSFPLDFGVFAPRKYVRVPWNTSEEELLRFITQIWSPPQPVVIVSLITGINSDSEWNNGKRTMVAFRSAIKNAAISTDMWLITHGLHLGPTKTVGLTYKGELEARTAKNARERSKREPNLPLVLIGISPVSIIRNSDKFIGGHVDYGLSDRSDYRSQAKYLDPNHTHYILIDDSDMRTPQELSLRTRIEYKLMEYKRFACPSEDTSEGLTDEETMTTSPAPSKDEIPIVCLLIGGAQSSVRAINERFLIEVPILICKGTGFLADSISFAADMIRKKGSTNQKVAKSLKSDLVKRVLRQGYSPPVDLEVNTIISIAKVHGESASGRVSIVDIREWEMDAGLLHRELLQLLLHFHRSQRQEGDHLNFLEGTKQELKLKEMCRRLQLLMDWNEPELAKSEIFEQDDFPKNSIPISIFEQAVVRRNREPFVELFLDRNFCLQKYFTQKRIRRLIVLSAPDFFNEVCMSGILGRKDARLIGPSDDISLLINSIIQKLTGFHDTFQLADFMTQLDEIKCVRFLASEKQSFISMTLLSVLLNRHQLAKVLIRRSSYPIPLAIFCSLIYKRLRHYCFFWHRRNELKDQAKEMADFAKGILGLYYDGLESKAPGKHILEHVNPEFGHVTTLQLAFKAELMDFMAHPCCQQYITSEYYGGLQFRNVRFGICRMPESLKAILCAYLLIPCRWWISFTEDDIVDEGSANPEAKQSGSSTKNPQTNDQKNEQPPHFVVEMPEIHSSGSFYLECAKRTWESPMIKFHLQYFNYILFLILLAFCCIMPACGRFDIDTLAWLWCLTITVELALTTFKNYMKSNHFPLKWNCVDCGIQVVFLLLFLFLRLGPWSFVNFGYMNPKTGRMVICFGMVYFTYRIPFV